MHLRVSKVVIVTVYKMWLTAFTLPRSKYYISE